MRIMIIAVGIAVTTGAPVSASADSNFSGADLLEVCGRPSDAWASFCHGYVQAAWDAFGGQIEVCLPPGATRGNVTAAVETILAASPALHDLNGAALVAAIMDKLFPC